MDFIVCMVLSLLQMQRKLVSRKKIKNFYSRHLLMHLKMIILQQEER